MIKQIIPYLYFNGNAEEAINFYKDIFGAEKVQVMRYGDAKMPGSEEYKNKILHGKLESAVFSLNFSDTFEGNKIEKGSNV